MALPLARRRARPTPIELDTQTEWPGSGCRKFDQPGRAVPCPAPSRSSSSGEPEFFRFYRDAPTCAVTSGDLGPPQRPTGAEGAVPTGSLDGPATGSPPTRGHRGAGPPSPKWLSIAVAVREGIRPCGPRSRGWRPTGGRGGEVMVNNRKQLPLPRPRGVIPGGYRCGLSSHHTLLPLISADRVSETNATRLLLEANCAALRLLQKAYSDRRHHLLGYRRGRSFILVNRPPARGPI